MSDVMYDARSESETDALGAALASVMPPQITIALCGTLGAGKTRLVQAVAAASGVQRDNVTSPTFVLCQHYHGNNTIHHLDAYRVRDEDEWFELGVDELFQQPGWTFVEWADRFPDCLPDNYLRIDIEVAGEHERRFRVTSTGAEAGGVIERLRSELSRLPGSSGGASFKE